MVKYLEWQLNVEKQSLVHFFDPYLAINTSLVDSLPHQITAVYDEMLGRQPLRFL